jgi:hypothetical protein
MSTITKDSSVHFITCNRALCCSGLCVRILSPPSQIQVQAAVPLWTIRTFIIDAHARGKGEESAKVGYVSEPAQENTHIRWKILSTSETHGVHDIDAYCTVMLCASKDFYRSGDLKLSFEKLRTYLGLSTE